MKFEDLEVDSFKTSCAYESPGKSLYIRRGTWALWKQSDGVQTTDCKPLMGKKIEGMWPAVFKNKNIMENKRAHYIGWG